MSGGNPLKQAIRNAYNVLATILPRQSDHRVSRDAARYWSRSGDSPKVRDLSHWRGSGRWSEEEWLAVGARHYDLFRDLCRAAKIPPDAVTSMVEWGPGGGANAVRFAEDVPALYGVDISSPNLDECSAQLRGIDYRGFTPVLVPADRPEDCLDEIDGPVDLFLSTAVFQHFPSKEYGRRVLRVAHELLGEGGVALVQTRYDSGRLDFRPKKRAYRFNAATYTSYGIDEFWELCLATGLTPLSLQLEPDTNYAYYFLVKRGPAE